MHRCDRRAFLWPLAAAAAVALAGCGAGNSISDTGGGDMAPPIHISRTRASSPVGYAPAQVRHAYGFDQSSATGAGQTIAIVDACGSPTIAADLSTFSSKFGLPQANLTIAYVPSKPRKSDAGWALETSLDVEWAHAIAPGANILLVVAPSASTSALLAAVDYAAAHAKQVSMSWGGSEFSSEASLDSHFKVPGVTFTASSGDSGGGPEWPSVSPYVVAVGGTTLPLDAAGNLTSAGETAWNGSNGGTSRYETEPAYQQSVQTSARRQVPDVAYNADPNTGVAVYDSTAYQRVKGWFEIGGTSAGAPQWAALCALVNQQRSAALNTMGPALYGPPSVTLRDILSGNSSGGQSAKSGYDLVTGLGSPVAGTVPALVSSP